jgi:hypothetical protein
MPLGTFAELKAAAISYCGRNDVLPELDSMIAQVESELYANNGAQVSGFTPVLLRIREMDTKGTDTLSTSSRYLALPSSFEEMRNFRIWNDGENIDDTDLDFKSPGQMTIRRGTGRPWYFGVTSQFEFDVVPDIAYTVEYQYYAKLTPLSDANPTNAVLTNYPFIYLNGLMSKIYTYGGESDLAAEHENKFILGIMGANNQNRKGTYGPGTKLKIKKSAP